jgi:hypothetical protein
LPGDFLEIGDPICQGPVPRDGDLIAERARFICESYGVPFAEAEATAQRQLPAMELICIDRFPVITRFNGLGQLSPAALRSLWDERGPVTPALRGLGAAVWHALREPSPLALQPSPPAVRQSFR